MKFSKYKLGVTALHAPKKIFNQQVEGKPAHVTIKDLTDAGVPESEIERHIELGTIVGLEGAEIEEDKEGGDKVSPEEEFAISLSSYPFIGKGRAKALLDAGYGSREKILEASNEDLAKVKGFEEAEKIEALRKLLNG